MALKRSIYCGMVREENKNQRVTVMGWVQRKRDMGGVLFVDLRDKEGLLQVVFDLQSIGCEGFGIAEKLKNEYVIAVKGIIEERDESTYNPNVPTGTVELRAHEVEILSESKTMPFPIEAQSKVKEELRLKYRFLDLRRPDMYSNLKFRHDILKSVRRYLEDQDFMEVETPMMTKSTPEGARDYLVPSRVHKGQFYALPQSPQIFKQLLMVSGVDKYYQVARCFRDEDLRADRQPEFTQVDMELSFVDQEEILQLLENLFQQLFKDFFKLDLPKFKRLTYAEAMKAYGSDKPDLRFDLPIVDLGDIAKTCSFKVFRQVMDQNGYVRAINAKDCASFTRSQIELLTDQAISYGAKGMAWIAVEDDGSLKSVLTKFFKEEEMEAILKRMEAKPGDLIIFCADKKKVVETTLGRLRLDLGDILELRPKDQFEFVIVTEFPLYEYDEEAERFAPMHHPFTMPVTEDLAYLTSDPERVRAKSYDIVLNGIELGSGSIRIHEKAVQEQVFSALGFSKEEIEERFGFMVNAFQYGTPPHGGFAFGLDRLVMMMVGADSLREVIAFPKVRDASCVMTEAPGIVDEEQLEALELATLADKMHALKEEKRHHEPKKIIDVQQIAHLSQLIIEPEDEEKMAHDLNAMIEFAEKLEELNTDDLEPIAHVIPVENVFREDVLGDKWSVEELLSNAPEKANNMIYVPKVVE